MAIISPENFEVYLSNKLKNFGIYKMVTLNTLGWELDRYNLDFGN
jgi:hypothetical protein